MKFYISNYRIIGTQTVNFDKENTASDCNTSNHQPSAYITSANITAARKWKC